MKKKVIGMIPSRMNSTRFPGKALALILGKPMIYWVYKSASKVKMLDEIFVATSDKEIEECCKKYNIPCICNKTNETTAAQKIAIESDNLDGDIYINIQGDEPLIDPGAIESIIDTMLNDESLEYVGLKSKITNEEEFYDRNVVKVVVDNNNFAMYFSRSPIPYEFEYGNTYRVMGLYGYTKEFLKNFKNSEKSDLEKLEHGIEMLRVMEKGHKIKLIDTDYKSVGVDLKKHIKEVEKIMLENGKYGEYTDLYDENKNLTGEKLFREKGTKLIVPKGRYSVVVLVFIENSKGEFLFQMTSKRKKNVWATTGGHVKSGQTSKEAVIEEIKEELGIDINEDEVKLFKTYKYDDAFKDVFYIKKDIDINSLTYEKDEVEYVKYLTKDEILDLINNNGNIRKTNIDAFLDIINSK
jgi:3-deoxy-manno-octulosonate cytidylyltransferase (CMP-KDO synthetase)